VSATWAALSAAHRARKLLHLETRIDIHPITGEASKTTTLLFPRFHPGRMATASRDPSTYSMQQAIEEG